MSQRILPAETLDATLDRAREAALAAGAIVRDHWDKPRQIRHKGRIDLVTQTDLAVEEALRETLEAILPDAAFLGEETASEQGARLEPDLLTRRDAPVWIVDPLDGTTNFAHKLPFVALSLALWDGDGLALGVVHNPILQETFTAARGRGAFLNGEPCAVTATDTLQESLVATGFPYDVPEHAERVARWLAAVLKTTRGVRRYGSAALDLAYLACGRYDAFYELHLKPWDTAAGVLLVQEAGGAVSRMDGATPHDLFAPDILATNGRIHTATAALLRD